MKDPTRPFVQRALALCVLAAAAAGCGDEAVTTAPDAGSAPPVLARGAAAFAMRSVTTGNAHACGLTTSGAAYCWGANSQGELGNGGTSASTTPVLVAGDLTFTYVESSQSHTCGLTRAGQAYCWGANHFGQFGNGTTVGSTTPVLAAGGMSFGALSVGVYHTCGLTRKGTAYCWGANGADGIGGAALGATSTEMCDNPNPSYRGPQWPCSTLPVAVSGNHRFRSISASLWYTCGLADSGRPYCWGWNFFFQLGDDTDIDRTEPTPVQTELTFASLSAGAIHTCASAPGGEAYCWGARHFNWGQLGNGSFEGSSTPTRVVGGIRFASLAPSRSNNIYTFSCGVATGSGAYCWGVNNRGQLGSDAATEQCTAAGGSPCSSTPIPVSGDLDLQAVSTGSTFACGVTRAGDAHCWGWNGSGQLGNGTTEDSSAPVRVAAPG